MKSIHEVIRTKENELKQKELAIQQLLKELEALRLAAKIMAEDEGTGATASAPATAAPSMTMAPPTPAAASVREPGYTPGWSSSPKQFP